MEVFTARTASAMGAVFARNWLKERGGFRPVPMITFVGSPTIVEIPPTFAANTSAISNGMGSILRPSNTWTVNGTMMMATVTMSRRLAIPAVKSGSGTHLTTAGNNDRGG